MGNLSAFKKTNPFLMVLLSILSMGIYVPYWFLSRKKGFDKLNGINLQYSLLKLQLAAYIVLFLYQIIDTAIFSDYGIAVMDSIDLIITSFGLGIMYFSVFRVSEIIEAYAEEQIFNRWLLLLFHIWYLQFKMNKLIVDDEQSMTVAE